MFARHVYHSARLVSLLRNSSLPHSLRSFDQCMNRFHLSRSVLGYASSGAKPYPYDFDTPKTHSEPSGFVASHRWFLKRPQNELLQANLFGSSPKTMVIEKNYMSAKLNASVSGAPVRDGFSYSEVHRLSDIPLLDPRLEANLLLMGLDELTPVQKHAISILSLDESVPIGDNNADRIVGQYDLMAAAQTGSGKTLAYLIPIINRLLRVYPYEAMQNVMKNPMCQYPSALILAPTRELVQQIREVASKLCYRTFCRPVGVYGGESPARQQQEIFLGCHVAIATPGRLLDFMKRGVLHLENCRSLVIDEADRMLDMGFEEALREILESPMFGMPKPRDSERQTCLFSATFPREVALIAQKFLRGPRCISLTLSDHNFGAVVPEWGESVGKSTKADELNRLCHIIPREITQQFRFVSDPSPHGLVKELADLVQTLVADTQATDCEPEALASRPARILIFCNTKLEVDTLDRTLYQYGIKTVGLHGDKSQDRRSKAIELFKQGRVNVMVASSVAARGLDIPDVTAVINIGFPQEAEDYVHRIGRTGRMGHRGEAITLVNPFNLSRASSSVVRSILSIAESSLGVLDSIPSPILEHAKGNTENSFKKKSFDSWSPKPPMRGRNQFSSPPRNNDRWRY